MVSDSTLLGREAGSVADGVKIDFAALPGGATVSKKHAMLRRDSTGVFLEDIGSGNGTFVNEERLPQGVQRQLVQGDHVRLGAVRLVFSGV